MVRPNSIIGIGSDETRPDYDYSNGITFHVFEPAEGGECSAVVISTEGREESTISVKREGRTVVIRRQGPMKPWRVCLRSVSAVASVEGGSSERGADGTIILPGRGGESMIVKL